MTKHLPARPRVVGGLPVLRRRRGELQIGLDPKHAIVVGGLSEAVVAAAGRLTGHRTAVDLLGELGPADRRTFTLLLGTLLDQGLLEEATPVAAHLAGDAAAAGVRGGNHPVRRADLAIGVWGNGRLAVAVACLLAGAGVGWVHVVASGAVQPEDVGTGYLREDVGSRRAVAARLAVRRTAPAVRTAAFDAAHRPDLVVVADTLVPSPSQVAALHGSAQPHLAVRVRDTVGIVGPFVVPGVTSCLRCADLHRCDRDERWSHVATQLVGQVQLTDLAGTHATAAFASAQAIDAASWLRGAAEAPATCEVSVELDLRTATARHRRWPAHSACSCGARHVDEGHRPEVAADDTGELRHLVRDGDAT